MNPYVYDQLIFDKSIKNQWGKNNLVNKLC